VALVLDAIDLAEFRYIVMPGLRLTLVMQQGTRDRRYRTLLCYYDDEASREVHKLTDKDLLEATCADIQRLSLAGFDTERIVFSNIHRWALSGTVISPAYDAARKAGFGQATERLFLAGDYLCTAGWGYGMDDAVTSGTDAGARVQVALRRHIPHAERRA
jgi:hypothetical protein